MAFTGQFLLLFLLGHAAGNATFWAGRLNGYAAHLHALPALVWVFRVALIGLVSLHIWQGIALTLENRGAGGGGYAVTAQVPPGFSAVHSVEPLFRSTAYTRPSKSPMKTRPPATTGWARPEKVNGTRGGRG